MSLKTSVRVGGVLLFAFISTITALAQPIRLRVDATEAPRRLYHVDLTIPAAPGPLNLFYPKWIPGEHAPTGPITDVAGLRISSGGRTLEWKRDSVEMFAFHIDVPQGASSVDVKLDFLSNSDAAGFSSAASATAELAFLSWNQLVLYPQGKASDDVQVAAELRLPADWKFGTALPVAKANGSDVQFKTVSLTTLVDSPVLTGRHYRRIELSPGSTPAHYLDVAADTEEALNAPTELIDKYKKLVKEAQALFGATHYREYHFLLALSDQIAHFGLEHHESSDNQSRENFLTDSSSQMAGATLLPHEFVHSWNGKYRRPEGLATRDYEQPMKGDLLWVYEGLTEYLGWVLTARSGLRTPDQNRQFLAADAATLDNRAGRQWRSLADTAVAAQLLYDARNDWESSRRGVDFYEEGLLIWLEADTIIRKQTQGRKSLDDFCRAFYGGASGPPEVRPYTLESLTETLNGLAPYDWKSFFETRIHRIGTDRAPLGGIEAGGYKLSYVNRPSEALQASEQVRENINLTFSIGLKLNPDGTIIDVLPEKVAAKAGIGPGMKIVGVNDRKYSIDVLREEIRNASKTGLLDLLVANGKSLSTYKLNYRDGEKYPVLERNGQAALLDEILKPLTR
ncbi:MAG TPA: M61 family peptidase [Terriglobia bacterium]|nr:M61 family peptidase [Terriglobia bacterium]